MHVPILATRAEVENDAVVSGAQGLGLNATTTPKIETTAKAGASGDSVSVGGAVAITVASTDTIARVGSGADLSLTGVLNLNAKELEVINADNTIAPSVQALADGTTSVDSVGVGAVDCAHDRQRHGQGNDGESDHRRRRCDALCGDAGQERIHRQSERKGLRHSGPGQTRYREGSGRQGENLCRNPFRGCGQGQ